MTVNITTDTAANDRAFSRASKYEVDERGYLRVWQGDDVAAIFAPGAWLSAHVS